MNNIYTSLAVYLITLVCLIIHTHRSRPNLIARPSLTHLAIAIRLALPFFLLHWLFVELGISVAVGYGLLAIIALLSFRPFGAELGIIFVVFAYIFYQWSLWFPDKKAFILQKQLGKSEDKKSTMVGLCGMSKTPMRLSGKIIIDGTEYGASCESGFLEENQNVRVVKVKPFGLVVEQIK